MNNSDRVAPRRFLSAPSRRDLFRTAGLATGGAMLLGLPKFLGGWVSEADAAVRKGIAPAPIMVLELEGQVAGQLVNVDGGGIFADVIPESPGPDMIQRKRPGLPRFEDIVLDIALSGAEKPLTGWITEMLSKPPAPKSGVIIYADIGGNETKRLEFTSALLSEIVLPGADARDNRASVLMTLRLTPQSIRFSGGKGKSAGKAGLKTKPLLSSNFRFNVQGLEQACKRIVTVSPIVATRAIPGTAKEHEKFRQPVTPGTLDCSAVRITLPEVDAGPFYAWFDDMALKGNPTAERAGLLEWLDPSLQKVIASVQLGNLGIVGYAPDPVTADSEEKLGGLVRIDLYCETMNVIV